MTLDEQQLLDAVSAAMAEPADFEPADLDPEVSADLACEHALEALDQLITLSVRDNTAHMVMANRIFVGLILARANTLARLLMAKDNLRFTPLRGGSHA